MIRNIVLLFGVFIISIGFYMVGLAQGTNRGVKGSNSASIIFFTGIHRLLKQGDIQNAIRLSEDGIATHTGVIQTAEDHPTSALIFLYPWMGDPLVDSYKRTLGATYAYLRAYPHSVSRDTIDFLARYQADEHATNEEQLNLEVR